MPFADVFAKYPQWGIPLFGSISDKGRQGLVKGASQRPAGGESLMEVPGSEGAGCPPPVGAAIMDVDQGRPLPLPWNQKGQQDVVCLC